MKIGFDLLLWTTSVQREHWPILEQLKACGYDGVEIPIFEGSPDDYAALGRELERLGLGVTGIAVVPSPEMNPIGADPQQREAGLRHLEWVVQCGAALGASVVAGPLHSTLGHFSGNGPTADERERGIAFHRRIGDVAGRHGVRLALEAVNRFECYFLNTMADLADYLDAVDHPNITGMYDTFHANIEEKNPVSAIGAIGRHLAHVHVSENDRGTPGKGHIAFAPVFAALKRSGYDGWITIEAFGRALPPLAAATRVWRDFFARPEDVYRDGLRMIKAGWDGC